MEPSIRPVEAGAAAVVAAVSEKGPAEAAGLLKARLKPVVAVAAAGAPGGGSAQQLNKYIQFGMFNCPFKHACAPMACEEWPTHEWRQSNFRYRVHECVRQAWLLDILSMSYII